jgi:hypothetical protein
MQETLLEEKDARPANYMPIEEDEHGTYILNSKDLRAIEHVQRLTEIGVDSLKIEGRTKSALLRRAHLPGLPPGDRRCRRRPRPSTRNCSASSTASPTAATPTASSSATTTAITRTTCAATPNPTAACMSATW